MSALPAGLRESLAELTRRAGRLEGEAQALVRAHAQAQAELNGLDAFLDAAPAAQARLEELSRELLGELMEEVETNLTHAVREILGQDRRVKSHRELKGGKLFITLEIENQGQTEDILHGQGGSVCNIVSVGLRLIGLAQLSPETHRPFLALDEQDCWLRPELVSAFVRIVAAIASRLSIQVLYISHHGVDMFYGHADKVIRLTPDRERGVRLDQLQARADPSTLGPGCVADPLATATDTLVEDRPAG